MSTKRCEVTKLRIRGRGGATVVQVGELVLALGGADREGEHYADVHAARAILNADTAAPVLGPWKALLPKAADSGSDGPMPECCGHAAAALSLHRRPGLRVCPTATGEASASAAASGDASGMEHRCVAFGGINFVENLANNRLVELQLHDNEATSGGAGGSGSGGSPSLSATFRVLQSGSDTYTGPVPAARTSHSLTTVPPPVVLPAAAAADASSSSSSSSSSAAAAPRLRLSAVLGARADEAVAVMCGGASPTDGPLTDVWLLRATASSSSSSSSSGEWRYQWQAVAATGAPAGLSMELHAAFVRPAVVQLESEDAGSSTEVEEEEAGPWVRLLSPPLLLVHGGRDVSAGDGRPSAACAVCDLYAATWRPALINTGVALAAAASTQSGTTGVMFSGQCFTGLCASAYRLDFNLPTTATATAAAAVDAVAFQPKLVAVPLKPAPSDRFAAAATVLTAPGLEALHAASAAPAPLTVLSWCGMDVEKDLAEAVILRL